MTLLLMVLGFVSLLGFSESQREPIRYCPPPAVQQPAPAPSDDRCFGKQGPCALETNHGH